jgi:hypothetical protein
MVPFVKLRNIISGALLGVLAVTSIQTLPASAAAAAVSPSITAISIPYGPTAGGTALTITGTNFTGVTSVQFGGGAGARLGTNLKIVSSTKLTLTTPAHTAGTFDIRVQIGTVNSPIVAADEFYFAPAPVITKTSTGGDLREAGGNTITYTGTGLRLVSLTVGGVEVPFDNAGTATQVTFTAPAHAAGQVPVVLTALGGGLTTSLTYYSRPVITSISPATGPTDKQTGITVSYQGVMTNLTIDGHQPSSPLWEGKGEVDLYMSVHEAGKVNIEISGPGGASEATEASTFTYVEPAAK